MVSLYFWMCGGSALNLRLKWMIQPSTRDEAFLSASITTHSILHYFVFYALMVEFDPGNDFPSILINSIQVYLFVWCQFTTTVTSLHFML